MAIGYKNTLISRMNFKDVIKKCLNIIIEVVLLQYSGQNYLLKFYLWCFLAQQGPPRSMAFHTHPVLLLFSFDGKTFLAISSEPNYSPSFSVGRLVVDWSVISTEYCSVVLLSTCLSTPIKSGEYCLCKISLTCYRKGFHTILFPQTPSKGESRIGALALVPIVRGNR